jgi:hypothetical protein
MIMRAWKLVCALVLFLTVVAACGPSVALITTPAKDMNLKADQVGTGYSMSEEQGLEEFTASLDISDVDEASDASYRLFVNPDGGAVMSLVVTLKQVATRSDLEALWGGFEKEFIESEITLEEYKASAIGDEATGRRATIPDPDSGGNRSLYFMGFRETNVVGVLLVVGTADLASEEIINSLGQTLAGQIK